MEASTEVKGLVHEYLGIIIDHSVSSKVVFTMFDYLEDVIVETDEDMKNSCLYYPEKNCLRLITTHQVYH